MGAIVEIDLTNNRAVDYLQFICLSIWIQIFKEPMKRIKKQNMQSIHKYL